MSHFRGNLEYSLVLWCLCGSLVNCLVLRSRRPSVRYQLRCKDSGVKRWALEIVIHMTWYEPSAIWPVQ
ncbi:hypothetical protein CY34DRAFT_809047 [Suillus luteus UH-Slu-Lm8-n1]|uniref:Uncharacterized protein n=1 Tax=Suillus luteus UH-Slu-Lm8-n1 TaxID=930992 RepID=A0A0D0B4A6_9AGAM|nr:hypothetical protein CY34DRAFT_809047 [Suillus luteus UH-Slu-Lm8-n1]